MADTLKLEIVTPEGKAWSSDVEMVTLTGVDGEMGVLPRHVPTLAVEAGASLGWDRYADAVVAIDRFGASAPGARVLAELGFTPENVAARASALLEARR